MLVTVRKFLTQLENNPVPMRTMRVVRINRETQKAYHVTLRGTAKPSSTCLHCGRRITHPVSLLYGIGPVCGGHFHVDPTNQAQENYRRLQQALSQVTWEGWLPKAHVQLQRETCWYITYTYQGKTYRNRTFNPHVKDRILQNADQILEIKEVEE